jgi:hypothetical protein
LVVLVMALASAAAAVVVVVVVVGVVAAAVVVAVVVLVFVLVTVKMVAGVAAGAVASAVPQPLVASAAVPQVPLAASPATQQTSPFGWGQPVRIRHIRQSQSGDRGRRGKLLPYCLSHR